jgi:hypothetical protein
MDDGRTAIAPCRPVTADEVAHYHEFGWVKLKGFIRPEIVCQALTMAQRQMGDDGDSNPPYGIDQPFFNAQGANGLAVPEIRAMIEHIGKGAKTLLARRGVGIRFFQDFFAPKLPSGKKTRNAGNGPTAFHQDFITFAVDRSGGMTFWIALEDYSADFGTMSFVNKSHRQGVMGGYHNYGGGDALDAFPELRDLEMSPQMSYEVGDVTVHSHLTVHGAGKNFMDRPRWCYIVLVQPSDARWNGAPPEAFDPGPLKLNDVLDDARFPILA